MRIRFRLRWAMLAIAAIAAVLALWREIDARNPVQQARRQLILSHERTAALCEEERRADPVTFSESGELGVLLRRLALWHSKRARKLRADPDFDPELERRQDEANDPVTPDQQVWLRETISRCRDRRFL